MTYVEDDPTPPHGITVSPWYMRGYTAHKHKGAARFRLVTATADAALSAGRNAFNEFKRGLDDAKAGRAAQ